MTDNYDDDPCLHADVREVEDDVFICADCGIEDIALDVRR